VISRQSYRNDWQGVTSTRVLFWAPDNHSGEKSAILGATVLVEI